MFRISVTKATSNGGSELCRLQDGTREDGIRDLRAGFARGSPYFFTDFIQFLTPSPSSLMWSKIWSSQWLLQLKQTCDLGTTLWSPEVELFIRWTIATSATMQPRDHLVELGVWRQGFPWVFCLWFFSSSKLMQGRTLPSQQINWAENFPLKMALAGAEFVAWHVCFDRVLGSSFFMTGRLEVSYYSTSGFPY